MKKYKFGLLVLLFVFGLFIFNTNSVEALVPGCSSTTNYSATTGESCVPTTTPPIYECKNGYDMTTGFICGCTSIKGYSATTGASCNPTTTPPVPATTITVISPNGGETWEKGTTKTIKWEDNSTDSSTYNIYLKSLNAGEDSGWRLITLSASGNSYNWTIPNWSGNIQDPSPYEVPVGQYKIQICKHGTSVCDLSDNYFKIVNGLPIITPPSFDCKNGYDVNTGFRCGCTSTSGYSAYDGNSCAPTTTPPIYECKNGYDVNTGFRCGCTSAIGYSSYDGNSCALKTLPSGCTSVYGYSPTTGELCSGKATPIPMPNPTPIATCTITSTLRLGSTGADVSCLQSRIGLISDGKFGPRTLIAVKAFQANAGLKADGVVGPKSISALEVAN